MLKTVKMYSFATICMVAALVGYKLSTAQELGLGDHRCIDAKCSGKMPDGCYLLKGEIRACKEAENLYCSQEMMQEVCEGVFGDLEPCTWEFTKCIMP